MESTPSKLIALTQRRVLSRQFGRGRRNPNYMKFKFPIAFCDCEIRKS